MQDPVYGYRSLGMLLSVNVQMEIPSHGTIQLDREVLALQPSELTRSFEHTWRPLGLKPETHFIIIFTPLSHIGPLPSLCGSTSNPGSQQLSLGYQSVPSPLFSNPINADWLRGLADASTEISRTNSPESGIGANHQPSTTSPAPYATQFVQSAAPHLTSELDPIEHVCRQHAISDDEMCSATFVKTEKSLLSMVLNYQQMSHILS